MVWKLKTIFYTKLLLNEYYDDFEEQLNHVNHKKTVRKLYDAGWKNSYFTCVDFFMLGYGYGVSQYLQFYDKNLDMYQVLPRP